MTLGKRLFWLTNLAPLVAALAAIGICWLLYLQEANSTANEQLDRESRRTEIFARLFSYEQQSVVTDLQLLADGDGFHAYLDGGKPDDLQRAIHRAVFFSQHRPTYDKVRYLDEHGQEVIRVNLNGAVVSGADLQNKADRSFFKKTMTLAPGEVYVSAFDLNVEHDQIETPFKPTIRFATPIFDAAGHRRGIYVVNCLGDRLVGQMQTFLRLREIYKQRFRMLNSGGFWIEGAPSSQEWGFMLPDRAGMTLAKTDPDLWARVSAEPEGQVANKGGYFTWHRVQLQEAMEDHPELIKPEEPYLIMASEITSAEWAEQFTGLRDRFLIIGGILFVLIAVSWRVFHARQRARVELDRFFVLTRDMLCIAGFDGYFKRLNPAWETNLGYTKEELTSKPFIDFIHPDDRERTKAEAGKLAEGGETVSFENRYLCKDGSYRWLSWNARSLIRERLIFASARDLTDRKRIDEQVLKLNGDLKERASQLEIANRELEAFSYSVSHDLRAPLRHIHGFVELLQKSPAIRAEESSLHRMGVIASAAKQMGILIDDLLSFSRTSRAEMHVSEVNMRELVDQVIEEVKSESAGREVKWEIQPLPTVPGDPALLRLVWMNLLSNALKFTGPRAVAKIEIGQGANEAKRAGEAVFFVRDNGVGFDMQYSAKLFGVFQRLHSAKDFEGTGIGLANVQRIVHRHGGRVWAESVVDVGTTFYFSMPLTPPPNPKTS